MSTIDDNEEDQQPDELHAEPASLPWALKQAAADGLEKAVQAIAKLASGERQSSTAGQIAAARFLLTIASTGQVVIPYDEGKLAQTLIQALYREFATSKTAEAKTLRAIKRARERTADETGAKV